METENIQDGIEVVKFKPQIENIETKISYNKILVKADCKIKCIYQSKTGSTYIAQKGNTNNGIFRYRKYRRRM